MCGIVGYVGLDDRELLKSMVGEIAHRGPDDANYYTDDNIGLGIARLSIIDIKGGRQPISNENGSMYIVFNGEIYNFLELRSILANRGHSFSTKSDTEVIIHAYEEWGEDCLMYLRGMFAFAIWDEESKKLFAARDRFGKKPLFYFHMDDKFLFASEIKSLLKYEDIPKEIDRTALYFYLNYHYIPYDFCIFKHIKKLPPASYLILEDDKELYIKKYWDLEFIPKLQGDIDSWSDILFKELTESVKIRLRSDVPIGCFLSGGIDSSVVASMASRILNENDNRLVTVAVGFEDQQNYDLKYANLVAEHLSTEHHEVIVTPESLEILPRLVWHIDEPFGDTSIIPTYQISKVGRELFKVALTGDGGDELFMGYHWMFDHPNAMHYIRLGSLFPLNIALRIARYVPIGILGRIARISEAGYIDPDPVKRYYSRIRHISPDEAKLINIVKEVDGSRRSSEGINLLNNLKREAKVLDDVELLDYLTIRTYLTGDILVKVDRMSMAVSLEVRCPLLDHVLATTVAKLPSWTKYYGGETKIILKKMALRNNLLPIEIVKRAKRGFSPPLKTWFKEGWLDIIKDRLSSKFIAKEVGESFVEHLLREPLKNTRRLFALTTLSIWHDIYIEETLKPNSRL